MNIVDKIEHDHAVELRKAREAGYRAGYQAGMREGYSSRVLDEDSARHNRANQRARLTDSSGYFIGPVTVEAEGGPGEWDVVFRFGADTFKLRQSDAVALDIDAQTAIYDGPEPYEEDIDAAMKARIEEDKDF